MKKLLILGGRPIGSTEMVNEAHRHGYYVIVTDYLPRLESPAKIIADECWDISTADVDVLEKKCKENHINGILTAVHEFNINRMLELCERLNLPCYCKRSTWLYCDDKSEFKKLCVKSGVPVAHNYNARIMETDEINEISYPVITKPIDGSGSRGFSICKNAEELQQGYKHALNYSPSKRVLIEDYIPYNAVIIHYTMTNGHCVFSGISDKYSCKFPSTGASVMGLQLFPSIGYKKYIATLDKRVRLMFEQAGFTDGPIWIEAFYNGEDEFIFNEMGYRFGGSMTNYPVEYFYGIDQMSQLLNVALGNGSTITVNNKRDVMNYCILPVHIRPGIIESVEGINTVKNRDDVYAVAEVHYKGDIIQEWGSAQQVFCYLHILYNNIDELKKSVREIMRVLKVTNNMGEQMLYSLYNIENLIVNKQNE